MCYPIVYVMVRFLVYSRLLVVSFRGVKSCMWIFNYTGGSNSILFEVNCISIAEGFISRKKSTYLQMYPK